MTCAVHHVELDINGVIRPLHLSMLRSKEILSFCLPAIDVADFDRPPMMPDWPLDIQLPHSFDQPSRRKHYSDWLTTNAFRDLARALRQSLESALVYIVLAQRGAQGTIGFQDLIDLQRATVRRANKANFPKLFTEVKAGLAKPLLWETQIYSVNDARNVLEHRGGLVGEADCNETGEMCLSLPRIKMFVDSDGRELELRPGLYIEKGGAVKLRLEPRNRVFKTGEIMTFDSAEAFDLFGACQLFATDLAAKLPHKAPAV